MAFAVRWMVRMAGSGLGPVLLVAGVVACGGTDVAEADRDGVGDGGGSGRDGEPADDPVGAASMGDGGDGGGPSGADAGEHAQHMDAGVGDAGHAANGQGDAGWAPGGARDATVDLDAGRDAGAQGATTPADAAATTPYVTDAALAAIAALTPEALAQDTRCDAPPVDSGIGLGCTPRGRECRPHGLTCTADFRGDAGFCTILGCGPAAADCGTGAACCTLLQAGGVSLCYPQGCYPTTCLENFR